MNVGTEQPPLLTLKRLVLFFCFTLSGILLDTYLFWWSHQFVSVCDSEKVTPGGFILLFTSILFFPALMSIIFGRNKSYISICLAVWITYCISCIAVNLEPIDHHCYRDVGDDIAITFLFTIVFSAVIFAITCAYGWIARE
jgi:hypothetical protein